MTRFKMKDWKLTVGGFIAKTMGCETAQRTGTDIVVSEILERLEIVEEALRCNLSLGICVVCGHYQKRECFLCLNGQFVCLRHVEEFLQRQDEESPAIDRITNELARIQAWGKAGEGVEARKRFDRWCGYLPDLAAEFKRQCARLP